MKNLLKFGFFGGAIGGALVDLIYITFAGPSGLFTLMGITGRIEVFISHVILGGILGIIFAVIFMKIPLNIYFNGLIFGLLCLGIIGGIPSSAAGFVSSKATIFGFIVWLVYGAVLTGIIKIFAKKNR